MSETAKVADFHIIFHWRNFSWKAQHWPKVSSIPQHLGYRVHLTGGRASASPCPVLTSDCFAWQPLSKVCDKAKSFPLKLLEILGMKMRGTELGALGKGFTPSYGAFLDMEFNCESCFPRRWGNKPSFDSNDPSKAHRSSFPTRVEDTRKLAALKNFVLCSAVKVHNVTGYQSQGEDNRDRNSYCLVRLSGSIWLSSV